MICDAVLIKEDVRPRIIWRKGRIVNYIKRRDGKIRVVKLVIVNSNSEMVELGRPLHLIVPSEIINSKTNDIAVDDKNTNKNTNTDQIKTLM